MSKRQEIENLLDAIQGAETCLGDTEAQASAERALFGDAWPGAFPEITRRRQGLADMEAELISLGYAPCMMPLAPEEYDENELPF